MGINQGLYTSTTDLWETPQDFFDGLDTEFCFELLAAQPTIDPIHAAGGCYCRECKYYLPDHICGWNSSDGWLPDDFCSYGRRREDNA